MKVFRLTETYKDNDEDTVGVYKSMQALARGFADHVASMAYNDLPDATRRDPVAAVTEVARVLADTLPGLCDVDWAEEDDEGYTCRYGKSTFGVEELEVTE